MARGKPDKGNTHRGRHDEKKVDDASATPMQYAERMFPAPVDLGIAQADRAVCSVEHGTRAHLEGGVGESSSKYWWQGGGPAVDVAVQGITIYPPTRGLETQGDPFEPVKIGILIDMDLNQLLADWIDPTILAIEDAMNEGVWARSPVQLVVADARGLPRENYRKVIEGYKWLVEQGCVVILGPMISDNCLVIQDTANEVGVPCIGWTGAHKFASEYCFTVANGDIPTEGVMCAQWLAANGIERTGLFWEAGSSGKDYAEYFRDTALQLGMTSRTPSDSRPTSRRCATSAPRVCTTAATGTRRSTSQRPSRPSTGIHPVSWERRSCSIRTRTHGRRG
jgi:branched-chain amino acid transport system substrate-binding protein